MVKFKQMIGRIPVHIFIGLCKIRNRIINCSIICLNLQPVQIYITGNQESYRKAIGFPYGRKRYRESTIFRFCSIIQGYRIAVLYKSAFFITRLDLPSLELVPKPIRGRKCHHISPVIFLCSASLQSCIIIITVFIRIVSQICGYAYRSCFHYCMEGKVAGISGRKHRINCAILSAGPAFAGIAFLYIYRQLDLICCPNISTGCLVISDHLACAADGSDILYTIGIRPCVFLFKLSLIM